MAWTPATTAPPASADPERSIDVLATNGTVYRVAYTVDDSPHRWKIAGRDYYDFDNVTHWQPLPAKPTQ
jgi:hypothetical protein